MSLIDRQAAIDVIDKIFPVDPMRNDYTQGIACGAALATEYIKQMPSAEPKKGSWSLHKSGALFICSVCEQTSLRTERYCPNCGARMEEVGE